MQEAKRKVQQYIREGKMTKENALLSLKILMAARKQGKQVSIDQVIKIKNLFIPVEEALPEEAEEVVEEVAVEEPFEEVVEEVAVEEPFEETVEEDIVEETSVVDEEVSEPEELAEGDPEEPGTFEEPEEISDSTTKKRKKKKKKKKLTKKKKGSTSSIKTGKNKKSSKTNVSNSDEKSDKSKMIALLLCFFLGLFSAHRFYVGKTGTAILQILTLGGLFVWLTIDLLMIILGKFRDKNGAILG